MFRSLKSLIEAALNAVYQVWLKVPTPLRRLIVLVGLITLWAIHGWLGYATTSFRGFLAAVFILPMIWIWSRQRSKLVNAVIILLMVFWFGPRSAGHGNGNAPDIIMQAMFWTLVPWYTYRVFADWRKSRTHTP